MKGRTHLAYIAALLALLETAACDVANSDSAGSQAAEAGPPPLVPWSFHQQKRYALDVDVSAGDRIRTQCTWQNTTNDYVLPGPLTENDMCSVALIAWPVDRAGCL